MSTERAAGEWSDGPVRGPRVAGSFDPITGKIHAARPWQRGDIFRVQIGVALNSAAAGEVVEVRLGAAPKDPLAPTSLADWRNS